MKLNLFVLILFLAGATSLAAQNQYQEFIIKDATMAAQAMVEKDADKVIKHLPPKVINMAGGIEFMTEQINEQFKMYDNQGMVVKDVSFGDAGAVYQSGEYLHCVLPQTVKMSFSGQEYEQEGHLFATSFDDGLSWYFLDMNQYDLASLKLFYPSLSDDFQWPEE